MHGIGGMVWYGIVWYGMAWHGMVWYGMVWYGMVYDVNVRANVPQVRSLSTKMSLAEFIRGSPGSRGSLQSGTWAAAHNPHSFATGARMR